MRENRLKKLIEFIGLDYKKEMLKLLFVSLAFSSAGIVAFIFLKEIIFIPIAVLLAGIFCYLIINSYSNKKAKILHDRDDEFISVINYFQTFVLNKNNVYQSFKKLLDYSSYWMKERIEKFLEDIDIDKSVKPFIDFSNNFQMGIVKNIMLSIYQMVDEGEDQKHLIQFETLFLQLNRQHSEEIRDKKTKSLTALSAFPMVGAMMITLLLSFSIIAVVGEMINVL